jgi:hypothetical protein
MRHTLPLSHEYLRSKKNAYKLLKQKTLHEHDSSLISHGQNTPSVIESQSSEKGLLSSLMDTSPIRSSQISMSSPNRIEQSSNTRHLDHDVSKEEKLQKLETELNSLKEQIAKLVSVQLDATSRIETPQSYIPYYPANLSQSLPPLPPPPPLPSFKHLETPITPLKKLSYRVNLSFHDLYVIHLIYLYPFLGSSVNRVQ